jgi:hypothetical protein
LILQLILVEKLFTRKLRVPTKHIVQLGDLCDSPPPLTIKHLFLGLFKIIQLHLTDNDEQDRLKDTLRQIEKSPAGSENILNAAIQWLGYMDNKYSSPENDEMDVACGLIDWAICTTICRDELDADIEKLKTLKAENTAALKTLRTGNFLFRLEMLTCRIGREESRVT